MPFEITIRKVYEFTQEYKVTLYYQNELIATWIFETRRDVESVYSAGLFVYGSALFTWSTLPQWLLNRPPCYQYKGV